jgi:hypothetical protein
MRNTIQVTLVILALACIICTFAHPGDDDDHHKPRPTPGPINAKRALCTRSVTCVLTPEIEEGPFYANLSLVRSNITYVHPHHPLVYLINQLIELNSSNSSNSYPACQTSITKLDHIPSNSIVYFRLQRLTEGVQGGQSWSLCQIHLHSS